MSKPTEAAPASQPQEGERIRKGKLTGTVTITEDGKRLIVWDNISSPTVSVDNVGRDPKRKFSGNLHTGGPKSH